MRPALRGRKPQAGAKAGQIKGRLEEDLIMARGWWTIKYEAVDDEFKEPSEADLEHIAGLIQEGYTSGEIWQNEGE